MDLNHNPGVLFGHIILRADRRFMYPLVWLPSSPEHIKMYVIIFKTTKKLVMTADKWHKGSRRSETDADDRRRTKWQQTNIERRINETHSRRVVVWREQFFSKEQSYFDFEDVKRTYVFFRKSWSINILERRIAQLLHERIELSNTRFVGRWPRPEGAVNWRRQW